MDMISYISKHFRIDPQLVEFVFECEKEVAPIFKLFQETAQVNQFRVIEAFQDMAMATKAVKNCAASLRMRSGQKMRSFHPC